MAGTSFTDIADRLEDWLDKQPRWFSFALHTAAWGSWTAQDVDNLAAAACAEAGTPIPIGDPTLLVDFSEGDIASMGMSGRAVVLRSVTATRNVNALADGATLDFAESGLTAIYGDNGSGKSGFSRLIRNTCTSRVGAGSILPNAFETAGASEAAYGARIDGLPADFDWRSDENGEGGTEPPRFPEIMYFDSACAAADILGKKNDVLYVPPVLSLLERLSALVGEVSARLADYSAQLTIELDGDAVPPFARSSRAVEVMLESTDPAALRILLDASAPTPEDAARADMLAQLAASDPSAEISKLEARTAQLGSLRNALAELYRVCDAGFAREYEAALHERDQAQVAAEAARKAFGDESSLDGVGSDEWRALWEAARAYSAAHAYPGRDFPVLGPGTTCPLCQQPLADEAQQRMASFDAFVKGAAENALARSNAHIDELRRTFLAGAARAASEQAGIAIVEDESTRAALSELLRPLSALDDVPSAETLSDLLERTKAAGIAVRAELDALETRLSALGRNVEFDSSETLEQELSTLRARQWAAGAREALLADAEVRKTRDEIAAVRKKCTTRAISSLVVEISRNEVVAKMQAAFVNELSALGAARQPVYLKTRTQAGREYQEIALENAAEKVTAGQVLSEGEQRLVTIAGFFSLLDVVPNRSTVVFDDPATALDNAGKDAVAARIAEEACRRPVVVFTHDPLFCSALARHAERLAIPAAYRTVRREGAKAGFVSDGFAWGNIGIDERIRMLRGDAAQLQQRLAAGVYEDDGRFEREMAGCYGSLRAAWEGAVEEVLLAGAVERGAEAVNTQALRQLGDITLEDCAAVDRAIAKCAGIADADPGSIIVPGVRELESDIDELAAWVASILTRRPSR